MDDYKRTLYMQAMTTLIAEHKKGNEQKLTFVCYVLFDSLMAENWSASFLDPCVVSNTIKEFFPEFDALNDNTRYYPDGACVINQNATSPWWEVFWIEPRIRALECILRN